MTKHIMLLADEKNHAEDFCTYPDIVKVSTKTLKEQTKRKENRKIPRIIIRKTEINKIGYKKQEPADDLDCSWERRKEKPEGNWLKSINQSIRQFINQQTNSCPFIPRKLSRVA